MLLLYTLTRLHYRQFRWTPRNTRKSRGRGMVCTLMQHRVLNRNEILLACAVLLTCTAGCTTPATPSFETLVQTQLARYPKMEIQDWYKLLHQAAMGNRHLGVDDSLIYNYLLDEMERIETSSDEPLIEFISPDSSVIRFNLRPYKAGRGHPDTLFAAMQKTWESVTPSSILFESYWEDLERSSAPFTSEDLETFIAPYLQDGLPAIHHSETYDAAYTPAYRVLLRKYAPLQ